jgi:2-polyprenyl-3-methyl-5-hydroxy-6-metoxy-1,4-benzoquinol methylase
MRWDDHELEAVTECAVCGGQHLAPLYRELEVHDPWGWRIDRCESCGTGHLQPRPTPESIGKAYVGDYTPYVARPARQDAVGRRAHARRAVEDAYLARRWHYSRLPASSRLATLSIGMPSLRRTADRLVRFAPAPRPGARLLDIGCATGTYMELMRDLGWETRGVEMDAGAVETARRSGLDVRQGTMGDVSADVDGTFDHITVGHVIEHVHRPVDALRATRRVLRPGGRLWIGTPNLASVGSRLFRSRWRALEPPRHLVLFTPGSLALALRETGFSGVELVRSRPSAAWHLEESAKLAGVRHRRPLRALARVLNAASYVRPALSDEMTFIATAPSASRGR